MKLDYHSDLDATSIELLPLSSDYIDRTWLWLNDPEVRALTMTSLFTREQQIHFFASLPFRNDYLIWGVSHKEFGPIGAAGLKNHRGRLAEYWGYIGSREYWGLGLGSQIVAAVLSKAREHGFVELDLKVSKTNTRAIALYKKHGFIIESDSAEEYFSMIKRNI